MNNHLIEVIEQYLKFETNYAVIINGGYGIGKTYYFKNKLAPHIITIDVPGKDNKKFIPVHISLFGVKSIEDIQGQILLSLMPILKDKKVKLASSFLKTIIRGYLQVLNLGNLDEYISDIEGDALNSINYDSFVICFDDLDRMSDALNINETLGYINTLVESNGAKIIIIANKDILLDKEKPEQFPKEKDTLPELNNVQTLMEKVIGITVQFIPDIEEAFDSIIKERYHYKNETYYSFLRENKKTIIHAVAINSNNLRNLVFFVEHFQLIFNAKFNHKKQSKNSFLNQKENVFKVLHFSLSIAIEFKVGNLKPSNFDIIRNCNVHNASTIKRLLSKTDEGTEYKKEYSEIFIDKYYPKKDFLYINSIFNYIVGISSLNNIELDEEFQIIFLGNKVEMPENQKILNSLDYINSLQLSDKEYRIETNKMLDFVDNGGFTLAQYPTAFLFATKFGNVLDFSIETLKKRFKKGIDKGIPNYKHFNMLRHYLSINEKTEFKEELLEIVKYCNKINDSIGKKNEHNSLQSLEEVLLKDLKQFIEIINSYDSEYRNKSFWLDISIHKIYNAINNSNKQDVLDLAFYFDERYNISVASFLLPEKEFLINLKTRINAPKKRKIKNLKNAILTILIEHIDDALSHF